MCSSSLSRFHCEGESFWKEARDMRKEDTNRESSKFLQIWKEKKTSTKKSSMKSSLRKEHAKGLPLKMQPEVDKK